MREPLRFPVKTKRKMRNRLRAETSREDQVTFTVKADKRLAQIANVLITEKGYRNFSEVAYDAIYRMVSAAEPGVLLPTLDGQVLIQDERDKELQEEVVILRNSAKVKLSPIHR